jgi:predicted membrane channel-forming protein YqfA (hemolysin III family)
MYAIRYCSSTIPIVIRLNRFHLCGFNLKLRSKLSNLLCVINHMTVFAISALYIAYTYCRTLMVRVKSCLSSIYIMIGLLRNFVRLLPNATMEKQPRSTRLSSSLALACLSDRLKYRTPLFHLVPFPSSFAALTKLEEVLPVGTIGSEMCENTCKKTNHLQYL